MSPSISFRVRRFNYIMSRCCNCKGMYTRGGILDERGPFISSVGGFVDEDSRDVELKEREGGA